MTVTHGAKADVIVHEGKVTDLKLTQTSISSGSASLSSPEKICFPGEDTDPTPNTFRSTFHIYHKSTIYLLITPTPDPSKDRYSGPTHAERKLKRQAKKARQASNTPPDPPDTNAFFLHTPYLSFHCPPQVLYLGSNKRATPAVLIHPGSFWREYKLQLGPTIAQALDPRGVVSRRYDCPDKKGDERALKGYRVRGWRLWGETGKEYVHTVKKNRANGLGHDPDVFSEQVGDEVAARAEEVVHLRWVSPLSRNTRRYHFSYLGMDFWWKGTGSVKENRKYGTLLRYCHLKLVARLPGTGDNADRQPEVCLGTYTSSVASQKSGMLELFDAEILRLAEEIAPAMLDQETTTVDQDVPSNDVLHEDNMAPKTEHDELSKLARLRKTTLYQVIVATAACMIKGEKEKRHTLLELIGIAGEGAGGAGG